MLKRSHLFLWILLMVVACRKDEVFPVNTQWEGTATNALNGMSITNHISAIYGASSCFPNSFNFDIRKYYKYTPTDSVIIQSFGFENIPPQSGTYVIKPSVYGANYCEVNVQNAAFYTLATDGDAVLDFYNVLDSEDNWLKLQVERKGKRIRGSYQVTFVINRRAPVYSANMPDTLRITNGSFLIERQ